MSITQAVFLAFIEGLTEFLPVSSTAHLVLFSQLLGIKQSDFVKSFEIVIQLGAILAVVALYFKELVGDARLWRKIIVAFLPSMVVGFVLYDLIKDRLIGNGLVTALALMAGGFVFLLIDKRLSKERSGNKVLALLDEDYKAGTTRDLNPQGKFNVYHELHNKRDYNNPKLFPETFRGSKDTIANISTKKLLAIGLFQSFAVVPGVSRAAASIFGGLLMGLSRKESTKFSFFLAIPTMLAAASLDLYKSSLSFSQHEFLVLGVGFVGAFVTALLTVKLFISFVQKYSFYPFGIYRILVGLVWLLLV